MDECSIAGTLEIIGDRWTILILRDAFRGVRRFDEIQHDLGIVHVPSNDFSLYDQVLDAIQLVGAAPPRYTALERDPLRAYFAMARGLQGNGIDVPAMEMTKWFEIGRASCRERVL